jgi:hypothetical protein
MIRSSGEFRRSEILHLSQGKQSVNLSPDAGTVQNLYTGTRVTNSVCESVPFIADKLDIARFSHDDNARFSETTIVLQLENELVICGVMIDDLAALSLRLRPLLESSENL